MFSRFRKKKHVGIISFGESQAQLIGSTDQAKQAQLRSYAAIRAHLVKAGVISEAVLDLKTAVKMPFMPQLGVKYPEDFNDFQDYVDSYYYVPFVARALDIKQAMIWQMGYDLESESEASIRRTEDFLAAMEADTVIRGGTLWAMLFGNMYWRTLKAGGTLTLKPLNPMKMGVKLTEQDEVQNYVYSPKEGKHESLKPEEVVHLKFNEDPTGVFGISSLRRCLPTIKSILYMEEKLPLIARRRADPLLEIQIGSTEHPVSEADFTRHKNAIKTRPPGEDLFHDGIVTKIEEVYKTVGLGGTRQTVEGIVGHFRENLISGLGVPEVVLAFGSTTLAGTAKEQAEALDAEIRAYQRSLKRLHENQLFKAAGIEDVTVNWRPLHPEDMYELSKKYLGEIEHGIISPAYARQRLGYPEEAGEGTVISSQFIPYLSTKKEKKKNA